MLQTNVLNFTRLFWLTYTFFVLLMWQIFCLLPVQVSASVETILQTYAVGVSCNVYYKWTLQLTRILFFRRGLQTSSNCALNTPSSSSSPSTGTDNDASVAANVRLCALSLSIPHVVTLCLGNFLAESTASFSFLMSDICIKRWAITGFWEGRLRVAHLLSAGFIPLLMLN